jgi:hypothetical protein
MKMLLSFILAFTLLIPETKKIQEPKKVFLYPVENKIQIGPMAKNKGLTFGVKNILLENLQDLNYTMVDSVQNADFSMKIELVFFDIQQISSGVSVFHKNDEETILRIKGLLYNHEGKKIKEYLSTGKSSEISLSTLIISEGGSINQQSVSNVIKKSLETLTLNLIK